MNVWESSIYFNVSEIKLVTYVSRNVTYLKRRKHQVDRLPNSLGMFSTRLPDNRKESKQKVEGNMKTRQLPENIVSLFEPRIAIKGTME